MPVLLVGTAQVFIGVPVAYAAGSFALTATYESVAQCLALLFCAAFGVLFFLSGVFNWTLVLQYGKIGRVFRGLGPFPARMLALLVGTFLSVGMILGTSNSRTFSERMWPLNGPIIEAEETRFDEMPQPSSGLDAYRAPGARRPPGH